MPLPAILNTNEVKDAAGAEVEFEHLSEVDRTHVFRKINEAPNLPCRLRISHAETGLLTEKVRRSLVRFDYSFIGVSGKVRTASFYGNVVAPIGDMTNLDPVKTVTAMGLSFLATTGAGTTVLFDCTGYGANCLVTGSQ